MSGVMLVNSYFGLHIEQPNDVGVCFPYLHRLSTAGGHESAFVPVWSIVAVGLAVEVEAHYLPAIAHHVNPVAFNGSRRTNT